MHADTRTADLRQEKIKMTKPKAGDGCKPLQLLSLPIADRDQNTPFLFRKCPGVE